MYFTDQGQTGHHDPSGRLYRLRPGGQLDCVLDHIPSPNGLVLNKAETMLFLAVTRANAIWRVPLMRDGTASKVGTFIQLSGGGGPDGMAIDEEDNLAICHVGLGTTWLFSALGEPMLRIRSPTGLLTTNCAYGGAGPPDAVHHGVEERHCPGGGHAGCRPGHVLPLIGFLPGRTINEADYT